MNCREICFELYVTARLLRTSVFLSCFLRSNLEGHLFLVHLVVWEVTMHEFGGVTYGMKSTPNFTEIPSNII